MYFLESNVIGVNRLFVLVYTNQDAASKRFKAKRYYLPNGIIDTYNVINYRKNFYDQPIDSDIKQYEEIRKLITGQGEDYTTGCLLDYDYIRNHYMLIAVDLKRQKELNADPKAIQQIAFVGQLKKLNNANNNPESMFILTILEKNKETRLKFSKGSVTLLYSVRIIVTKQFHNNLSSKVRFVARRIQQNILILQSNSSILRCKV